MTKLWLFVFIFNGQIYASGPYELEVCKEMLRVDAACIQKDLPRHIIRSQQ